MERAERDQQRLTIRTRRTGNVNPRRGRRHGSRHPAQSARAYFQNPFFTTKPTGSGTGLGLSISLGIVREHEGRSWAENATQSGARFVIELPIVAPAPHGRVPSTPASQLVADRLHVLVVDDEASVRVALQRYLSSRGHEVETTASGPGSPRPDARDAFDAVIIDMRMPDVSGEQPVRRAQGPGPVLRGARDLHDRAAGGRQPCAPSSSPRAGPACQSRSSFAAFDPGAAGAPRVLSRFPSRQGQTGARVVRGPVIPWSGFVQTRCRRVSRCSWRWRRCAPL